MALQRAAGNRAVAAAMREGAVSLQRSWLGDAVDAVGSAAGSTAVAVADAANWVGDRVGDALDFRDDEEARDFQEDRGQLQEWKAQGVRGPEDLRAPTGIGGFGAAYDPDQMQLRIRLAGGVTFADSITFAGDVAVVTHPNPGPDLTAFVAGVNSLPTDQRLSEAAPYLWTEAEKQTFIQTFDAGVESRWSERYDFHATRENWTDLGAGVHVDVGLHSGAKGDDEHVSVTAYKTPPGGAGNVGVVKSGADATTNTMVLNSPDVSPRQDNLLDFDGSFQPGAAILDAAGVTRLNQIGATYRGGGPGCRVCGVTITASSGGPLLTIRVQGRTEADARSRYEGMRRALMGGGNLDIVLRAAFEYDGPGDGYTVMAGNGIAQSVAEHEAGHMFGLGDEYAVGAGSRITGTGKGAGEPAKHDELVRDMGLEGAVYENDDGIMSLGTVVRPQHYATFSWALGELTRIDWALGPPVPVSRPGPPVGDFPAPAGETMTA